MNCKALARSFVMLIVSAGYLFAQSAWAQTADQTSSLHNDFKFEVASIKLNKNPPYGPGSGSLSLPDGIHLIGANTYILLEAAYFPEGAMEGKNADISKAPDWVISERYDIDARVADQDLMEWGSQTGLPYNRVYLRAALRNLLKERYKLQAHLVDTQVPYLSIVAIQSHNKLVAVSEVQSAPEHAFRGPSGGHMTLTRGQDENMTWTFFGCTMEDLAFFISNNFNQLAQDKSGLKGRYNFQFTLNRRDFAEDQLSRIQKLAQLGIHLQNDKGPGRSLVIDHIERPDAN